MISNRTLILISQYGLNNRDVFLDVIRAFSVISVLLYHLGLFRYGYLGVDVFFVLSGFVITNYLYLTKQSSDFNFNKFLISRINRLFPSMLLVIVITLIFGYFLYKPRDLVEQLITVFNILSNTANLHFRNEGDYFAPASESSLYIHFWSLSVEFVFYVFFALFIYFRSKIIVFLLLISFLLLVDEGFEFYDFSPRFLELLVGCFFAFANKYSLRYRFLILFSCFTLVLIYLINLDFLLELSVVNLVAFFIYFRLVDFSKFDSNILVKVLSLIGLSSYPIYLIHQPVLVFLRELGLYPTSIYLLLVFALILFIGILVYLFFELPVRRLDNKTKFTLYFLFLTFLFYYATQVINSKGFAKSYKTAISEMQRDFKIGKPVKAGKFCNFNRSQFDSLSLDQLLVDVSTCLSNSHSVLIGDSHAGSLFPSFRRLLSENNSLITLISYPGCSPFESITRTDQKDGCFKFQELISKIDLSRNIDVIFSLRWSLYVKGLRFNNMKGGVEVGKPVKVVFGNDLMNENQVISSFYDAIHSLQVLPNRIYIVGPIPEAGWHVPDTIFKRYSLGLDTNLYTDSSVFYERNYLVLNMLASLKSNGYNVIYPHELVCDQIACYNVINDFLLYRDDDHPSDYFADLICKEFLKVYRLKN